MRCVVLPSNEGALTSVVLGAELTENASAVLVESVTCVVSGVNDHPTRRHEIRAGRIARAMPGGPFCASHRIVAGIGR